MGHLKLAFPVIAILLTQLINTIFSRADIHEEMKLGVITPCPQKTKCRNPPDNYRRITVNSAIGNLVERESLPRLRGAALAQQHPYQYGFTEGVCIVLLILLLLK